LFPSVPSIGGPHDHNPSRQPHPPLNLHHACGSVRCVCHGRGCGLRGCLQGRSGPGRHCGLVGAPPYPHNRRHASFKLNTPATHSNPRQQQPPPIPQPRASSPPPSFVTAYLSRVAGPLTAHPTPTPTPTPTPHPPSLPCGPPVPTHTTPPAGRTTAYGFATLTRRTVTGMATATRVT
jgi:hypothetical protein